MVYFFIFCIPKWSVINIMTKTSPTSRNAARESMEAFNTYAKNMADKIWAYSKMGEEEEAEKRKSEKKEINKPTSKIDKPAAKVTKPAVEEKVKAIKRVPFVVTREKVVNEEKPKESKEAEPVAPKIPSPWENFRKTRNNYTRTATKSKRFSADHYKNVTIPKKTKIENKTESVLPAKKYDKHRLIENCAKLIDSVISKYTREHRELVGNPLIAGGYDYFHNVIGEIWKIDENKKQYVDFDKGKEAIDYLVATDFFKSVNVTIDDGFMQSTVPLGLIRKVVDPDEVLTKTNAIKKLTNAERFALAVVMIPGSIEKLTC